MTERREYDPERHRQYLLKHAEERICPPCAGRRAPLPERDSLMQAPFRCPTCRKVWVYRTQIERAVKQRRPTYRYSKNQPFL